MSIESHINLAIGEIQSSERYISREMEYEEFARAVAHLKVSKVHLTVAREELRTLRAQINKIEANL